MIVSPDHLSALSVERSSTTVTALGGFLRTASPPLGMEAAPTLTQNLDLNPSYTEALLVRSLCVSCMTKYH